MTNLIRQKVLEKLDNFNEYFGYLKKLQKEVKSEKPFVSDFHLFGNTERHLQLCIQSIIDICHLLVLDIDSKKPGDNYEVVSISF